MQHLFTTKLKQNSFPLNRPPSPKTSTYKMFRQSSNSSLSSISSNSDAAVLAGLPSDVAPSRRSHNLDETSSIASITSEMSAQTLRSIREQGWMDGFTIDSNHKSKVIINQNF